MEAPIFFTAAWSAIRPNVGKSFLLVTQALREAADAAAPDADAVRTRLAATLSEEELRRVEDTARAVHSSTAKTQIVVHALHRTLRRERLQGTGREEAPVRRGIPERQRWMSLPTRDADPALLARAARALGAPSPPAVLSLFGRWPAALHELVEHVEALTVTTEWTQAVNRVRRTVLSGITTLPHPIELQWMALRERGFSDDDRRRLSDIVASYDASMSAQTVAASVVWRAVGGAEIGPEG